MGLWTWVILDLMIPNIVHRNAEIRYYGSTGFCTSFSVLFRLHKRTLKRLESVGCWIEPRYKAEQIVTEYLYMWIALGGMIVLYSIMGVVLRKRAQQQPTLDTGSDSDRVGVDEEYDDSKAVAKTLLLYVPSRNPLQVKHILNERIDTLSFMGFLSFQPASLAGCNSAATPRYPIR